MRSEVRKLLGAVTLVGSILLSVAVSFMVAPTTLHGVCMAVGLMCLALALWRVAIRYRDLDATKQHRYP